MSVTLPQFLANLTMLPSMFGYGYVDGVYWTLEFELRFYLLVLFFLIVGLRNRLALVFMLWPALMLGRFSFRSTAPPLYGRLLLFLRRRRGFCDIENDPVKNPRHPPDDIVFISCITLFPPEKRSGLPKVKALPFSPFVIDAIIAAQFLFFLLLNTKKRFPYRYPPVPERPVICPIHYF